MARHRRVDILPEWEMTVVRLKYGSCIVGFATFMVMFTMCLDMSWWRNWGVAWIQWAQVRAAPVPPSPPPPRPRSSRSAAWSLSSHRAISRRAASEKPFALGPGSPFRCLFVTAVRCGSLLIAPFRSPCRRRHGLRRERELLSSSAPTRGARSRPGPAGRTRTRNQRRGGHSPERRPRRPTVAPARRGSVSRALRRDEMGVGAPPPRAVGPERGGGPRVDDPNILRGGRAGVHRHRHLHVVGLRRRYAVRRAPAAASPTVYTLALAPVS